MDAFISAMAGTDGVRTVAVNFEGNVDVTFTDEANKSGLQTEIMGMIVDFIPGVFVRHAYNHFHGNSFEYALRSKYEVN